ncbi:hypothetical protein NHQ30_000533 [Ciborinia camelliae]|nr:hypothetical protein NHQ30_000533 [Ciborinia camelliae]
MMFTLPKLGLLAIFLGCCSANLLVPCPDSATEGALKFQPFLDFSKDACYQTAAIDVAGYVNEGLEPNRKEGVSECRDKSRLDYSQTYVRQRCNHGWCAYLYGYYFEKESGSWGGDTIGWAGAYKHDWKHIIVWTLNDNIFYVSWSVNGHYTTEHQSTVRFEGTHPKLVYDRVGGVAHSFRKAEEKDEFVKNGYGRWIQSPLVSLERITCDINRKLLNNNWGRVMPALKKDRFGLTLDQAMPSDARNNEHFNPWN